MANKMKKHKCFICTQEFIVSSDWDEDGAIEEMKNNFGENTNIEDCVVVCHECWEIFKPENNPAVYRTFLERN